MNQNRVQKQQEVEALRARLEQDEMVIVTHYSGLTVKQMTELRGKLRDENASFKVTKNTLARRALEGTKFEHLADLLKGPTGIASSRDPMAAARVAYAFSRDNEKLVILGGAMGTERLDVEGVKRLALLPSLDALRGKLIGLLQAPGAQLARLANAYAEKGGAAAVPAAATEAPAAAAAETTAT